MEQLKFCNKCVIRNLLGVAQFFTTLNAYFDEIVLTWDNLFVMEIKGLNS